MPTILDGTIDLADLHATRRGAALIGPHGEVAEYLGEGLYLGSPGARIRRMSGVQVVPASHIGTEWACVPGRVMVACRSTGRWSSPVERRLTIET